jgi:Tol biopolymer transport system component
MIFPNFFDISKKGNRMVLASGRGDVNIWHVDLDSNGLPEKNQAPKPILASTFRDAYPQYSPDGAYLAFYSNRAGGATQTWVARLADQQVRQLTFPKAGLAGTASWSPDGKVLALDANPDGMFQIYTMSAEGGKMSPLTKGPASNFAATWSRDGRWLYFCSTRTGRNEVWKTPSGGGAAAQITRNGGVKAVESADGKSLYFSKDVGSGSVWEMPVSGGEERQISTSLYRNNFAVAKLGIYYTTATQLDGTASVNFYRFADRSTMTLLAIGRPEYGIDVSPDGRNLVYVRIDEWQSDLMLLENFR